MGTVISSTASTAGSWVTCPDGRQCEVYVEHTAGECYHFMCPVCEWKSPNCPFVINHDLECLVAHCFRPAPVPEDRESVGLIVGLVLLVIVIALFALLAMYILTRRCRSRNDSQGARNTGENEHLVQTEQSDEAADDADGKNSGVGGGDAPANLALQQQQLEVESHRVTEEHVQNFF